MRFMRIVLAACCLLAGTAFAAVLAPTQPIAFPIAPGAPIAPVPPQPAVDNTSAVISGSDGIVTGTVTNVQDMLTENRYWAYPGGRGPSEVHVLQVTVRVNKALYGMGDTNTFQLAIPISPYGAGDQSTAPAAGLKVGDQRLFCLRQTKDGYDLASTPQQAIMAVDKTDDIAQLIKNRPLTIIPSFAGNLYFGKFNTLTLKVTNNTDSTCTVTNAFLSGYYLAKRMENVISFSMSPDGKTAGKPLANPIDVPAHEARDITLYVSTQAPPSLALLGADSYLLVPFSARASLTYTQAAAPPTGGAQMHMLQSPALIGYAGYPLAKPGAPVDANLTPATPAPVAPVLVPGRQLGGPIKEIID